MHILHMASFMHADRTKAVLPSTSTKHISHRHSVELPRPCLRKSQRVIPARLVRAQFTFSVPSDVIGASEETARFGSRGS